MSLPVYLDQSEYNHALAIVISNEMRERERERERGRERETERKAERDREKGREKGRERLLRRECNLLTAVKGFKVDLEASRT